MNQTHSNKVLIVEYKKIRKIDCDALLTTNNEFALCVLTADCAPDINLRN